jgi:prefoldin subunit 5
MLGDLGQGDASGNFDQALRERLQAARQRADKASQQMQQRLEQMEKQIQKLQDQLDQKINPDRTKPSDDASKT